MPRFITNGVMGGRLGGPFRGWPANTPYQGVRYTRRLAFGVRRRRTTTYKKYGFMKRHRFLRKTYKRGRLYRTRGRRGWVRR